MALALSLSSLGFHAPVAPPPRANVRMETKADLEAMAEKLNPLVKFWDPLGMVTPSDGEKSPIMGQFGDAGTIGFLRHSEIKHGRVAMAAFVGFIVQANGIHFPWASTLSGLTYADIAAAGSPPAQWDAVPTAAKWQIFLLIGLLEFWGEGGGRGVETHYMKGGKPGAFPSFEPIRSELGQPPLDLFDPFGFSKGASAEKKAKGLLVEINNGRAAMIGIMGFVAAASVEGSVPALSGLIAHYDGECMAPFSSTDTSLPLVSEMLSFPKLDSPAKLFPYN
mmetsp:Transcript_56907/g.100523  ORF Transcript_56907/g.100523 Transcript_56907/m.100523 type:complete len:279 (-) Transcript_56907:274-1110(-)